MLRYLRATCRLKLRGLLQALVWVMLNADLNSLALKSSEFQLDTGLVAGESSLDLNLDVGFVEQKPVVRGGLSRLGATTR